MTDRKFYVGENTELIEEKARKSREHQRRAEYQIREAAEKQAKQEKERVADEERRQRVDQKLNSGEYEAQLRADSQYLQWKNPTWSPSECELEAYKQLMRKELRKELSEK